ncbi:hypothetical protein BOVATA_037860 [Babesia ovata]|uniref:Uncharacterized protein n=1 Tax=Babesia ovata TaxID=189622 RepID=A0A2H6KH24_9APIC|nr:uncharacterized protein BOVATA_037860 [Babesia ovata]GBE62293.1 hypothetical protein BOVATA_037860 [Babesia ovata]
MHHQARADVALEKGVVRPNLEPDGTTVETLVQSVDVVAANVLHTVLHSLQHGWNEGAYATFVRSVPGNTLGDHGLVLLHVVAADATPVAGLLARAHERSLAAHATVLFDSDTIVVEEVTGALYGAGYRPSQHAAAGTKRQCLHDVT